MTGARIAITGLIVAISLYLPVTRAQQTGEQGPASVPRLVQFSGMVKEAAAKPVAGITFALYKDQQGGAPVWMEMQNVLLDESGRYMVLLGSTKSDGLPPELFTSGAARWLGIQPEGQPEQPRVLLLSVPYAFKAADAETLGGLPASAFVLAAPPAATGAATESVKPADAAASVTGLALAGSGTLDFIPLWTPDGNTLGDSVLFQSGTGSSAKIGINTTTPASTLDVKGSETVRGSLNLPATGTATASGGKNSQPTTFTASVFNSGSGTAVPQNFRWQAEPVANDTANAGGSLNLLYGAGANPPTETGLNIASTGQITFVKGQNFPGSVSSVGLSAPVSDFTVTGSPVTGNGTLALNWTVPPDTNNTPNAIVKRDSSGNFTAGIISAAVVNATNATLNGNLTVSGVSNTANINSSGTIVGGLGVAGFTNQVCSQCAGVSGVNTSGGVGVGVYGSGNNGVYGIAPFQGYITTPPFKGVFGQFGNPSTLALNPPAIFAGGVGVWGDGGTGGYGQVGIAGTVDDGTAGVFENNDPFGGYTVFIVGLNSATIPFYAENDANRTFCDVDAGGNLNCSGAKHAIIPLDGGKRKVALSAIESPQNWFEDFGSARLTNGIAVVQLDPDFIQTVNTETDYRVFPVPNGDCRGLYVTNKTPSSFEVRELGGGTSNISFDYRITAIRRNYETVRFEDHTHDPEPRKMLERMRNARPASFSNPAGRPVLPSAGRPIAQVTHP